MTNRVTNRLTIINTSFSFQQTKGTIQKLVGLYLGRRLNFFQCWFSNQGERIMVPLYALDLSKEKYENNVSKF